MATGVSTVMIKRVRPALTDKDLVALGDANAVDHLAVAALDGLAERDDRLATRHAHRSRDGVVEAEDLVDDLVEVWEGLDRGTGERQEKSSRIR